MQCRYILPTPHASKTACFSENQQRGMETKYSFAYFWETFETFIVWIRMLCQVSLNQITSFLCSESKEDMEPVHIPGVQTNRMGGLGVHVLEGEEVVGHLGWTSHLAGPVEAEDQEVHHEAIVLHYERGKLKSPDNSIGVGVIHVLVVDHHVVLGSHVVGDVVVHDQPQ